MLNKYAGKKMLIKYADQREGGTEMKIALGQYKPSFHGHYFMLEINC